MFDSLFGAEGSLIVRFVVAFVIVLALIALTFWAIRRFGGTRVGIAAARGRQPRLAVVDAAPVDARRRLVLVRRDNVEHLLMIGGPTDIVVEENIVRAVPVTPPREAPVGRTPGAVEAASATRAPAEEWSPPPQEPPARQQPELPRELTREPPRPSYPRAELPARPAPRAPLEALTRATEALARAGEPPPPRPNLPPTLSPRPSESMLAPRPPEPSLAPTGEPEPAGPDAALANMAQRLEAALRRPGTPGGPTEPAERATPEFPPAEAPATAPNGNGNHATPRLDDKTAKSKSVLDSLEEEMASLLGRPPGKE